MTERASRGICRRACLCAIPAIGGAAIVPARFRRADPKNNQSGGAQADDRASGPSSRFCSLSANETPISVRIRGGSSSEGSRFAGRARASGRDLGATLARTSSIA